MHPVLTKIYYWRAFRRMRRYGSEIRFGRWGVIVRPEEITMGSRIYIGPRFYISARQLVLKDDIMIGPDVVLECDDHRYDVVGHTMYSVANQRREAPIQIEADVWLGARVTVLKGVTIGEGAVVGAGSIVTKNIAPYSINVGVPCRFIRPRFATEVLPEHLEQVQSELRVEEVLSRWREAGWQRS